MRKAEPDDVCEGEGGACRGRQMVELERATGEEGEGKSALLGTFILRGFGVFALFRSDTTTETIFIAAIFTTGSGVIGHSEV